MSEQQHDNSDNIDLLITFLVLIGAFAISCAISLIFLQTDYFSRRFLSHQQIQARRKREYSYRWDTCLKRVRVRYFEYAKKFALGGGDDDNRTNTTVLKNENDLYQLITEWLQLNDDEDNNKKKEEDDDEQQITTKAKPPRVWRMLGISKEENDEKEVYLEFESNIRVPLVSFGKMLAKAFEEKEKTTTKTTTTSALCFVADASSGLGSELLAGVADASKAGVAVIREPAWMVAFASLVEQRIATRGETTEELEKMKRILFGLCKLEAWRVRDEVGDANTVMFVLPGQAVTPVLLPLLRDAFPGARHVFAYDTCVNSVRRANCLRSNFERGNLPKNSEEIWTLSHDPTRHTTPLVRSLSKTLPGLSAALARTPVHHADTVEAWMGSIDSFVKLKNKNNDEDDETTTTKSEYVPYVLRLDYIMNRNDLSEGSDRYWIVTSLLRFITTGGSGGNSDSASSLPPDDDGGAAMRDAAIEWLRDFSTKTLDTEEKIFPKLSGDDLSYIEGCVVQHDSILVQDKTLPDTVVPSEHWTLQETAASSSSTTTKSETEQS